MNAAQSGGRTGIRYQPDEQPPVTLTIGLGLQLAGLNIAAIMLIPTVIVRAAGETETYLTWAVLASVTICGMTTMLQDQLALLCEQPDEISPEREVSLRLLRHHASYVRHQQFHDMDIVTVRVKPPAPPVSSGSE